MAKKVQRLGVTVKETIDLIYDMLVQCPNGCELAAYTLGKNASKVVSVLVQRGILERERFTTKTGIKCKYKWVACSAPTHVLYGSVTQELRDKQNAYYKKHYARKNAEKKAVLDTVGHAEPESDAHALEELRETPGETKVMLPTMCREDMDETERMSRIYELWNEIKSLGGYIADGELCTKTVVRFC